ncbi:cation transporter, partial [Enterobacter sp. PTB]
MHNSESMNADEFNTRSRVAKKSTLVSVAVNILLSFFQITVGVFSGSQGLIADGIHSLSDLVADFVV